MAELPEYVIDRIFDAPVALVWRAWTDPELLARWYGPGVETIIHKYDHDVLTSITRMYGFSSSNCR